MSARPDRRRSEGGFTLLEMIVVLVVAVPILSVVWTTSRMVHGEVQSSDAAASATESCRTAGQRIAHFVRAGVLSTCEVRATQADIDAAILAQILDPSVVIPSLDEWIGMPIGTTHDTFRFQGASGILSMNAAALTPVRALEFVMDSGETANGVDDDGDGLIDEGRLQMTLGTSATDIIASRVELCGFALNGRVLQVRLRCARRDRDRRVYRATATHNIFMRNS